MICLTIINRTIDLATEILVKQAVSMPTRYRDIFSSLAKEGLISKELSNILEKLVENRNYLAHEYFGMDDRRLNKILKDIRSIKDFIQRIKVIVRKEPAT